jgi:hypothetical protein
MGTEMLHAIVLSTESRTAASLWTDVVLLARVDASVAS